MKTNCSLVSLSELVVIIFVKSHSLFNCDSDIILNAMLIHLYFKKNKVIRLHNQPKSHIKYLQKRVRKTPPRNTH